MDSDAQKIVDLYNIIWESHEVDTTVQHNRLYPDLPLDKSSKYMKDVERNTQENVEDSINLKDRLNTIASRIKDAIENPELREDFFKQAAIYGWDKQI